MLASLVRFEEDAAGIEKTLRLLQGLTTMAVGLSTTVEEAAPWAQARHQFALARRYFRVLKWYPCWKTANEHFSKDGDSLLKTLQVAQWTLLGTYFFLEMPTITNTMRVTNYDLLNQLQMEANKFWVYAILASIFVSIYRLSTSTLRPHPDNPVDKAGVQTGKNHPGRSEGQASIPRQVLRRGLVLQLAIDCCDLVVAGAAATWIPADNVQVGLAYTVSTTLSGSRLWTVIQGKAG